MKMKIKTLSGEKEVNTIKGLENFVVGLAGIWVKWEDIKPILDEYQAAIENDQIGCSDYSLIKGDEYDDRI